MKKGHIEVILMTYNLCKPVGQVHEMKISGRRFFCLPALRLAEKVFKLKD